MPYYDTNTFANAFGSEAANLEYAVLSSMLNGNGFSDPIDTYANQDMRLNGGADGNSMLMRSPVMAHPVASTSHMSREVAGGSGDGYASNHTGGNGAIFEHRPSRSRSPPHPFNNLLSPRMQDITTSPSHNHFPSNLINDSNTSSALNGPTNESNGVPKVEYPGRTAQSTRTLTAEEAYRNVTKPYPYAQSYHYLVRHLRDR